MIIIVPWVLLFNNDDINHVATAHCIDGVANYARTSSFRVKCRFFSEWSACHYEQYRFEYETDLVMIDESRHTIFVQMISSETIEGGTSLKNADKLTVYVSV